jgi:hypothetical protein
VVDVRKPFGGPEHVLHYLARYTHRVAISDHRLISLEDGKVTFRWNMSDAGICPPDHRLRVDVGQLNGSTKAQSDIFLGDFSYQSKGWQGEIDDYRFVSTRRLVRAADAIAGGGAS